MSGAFLPRWLLLLIAFCAIGGHLQQMECKLTGCQQTVAQSNATDHGQSDSDPVSDHGDCGCQCHFSTFVASEPAPPATSTLRIVVAALPARPDRAPEAVCAEIDLPPQLA